MSRKRNNNEGTIYKKKDGKFRAQITIDGRRISHTANTWKECNVWRKKMISQLDEGLTYSGTKLTCKLFFSDWLSSKKGELQSSSSRQYDLVVRAYLIPNLGKIKLQNLRNDHIQRVYNRLRETGTGIPTIQKTHTVLHSALAYAVKTGLIVRNPASGVIVPKEPQKEMQILDETQVSQFLIAVIGHRWESLYFLAITSGMRQLEILGLKWSDVDWERQTIKVDRQLERSDGDGIKFTQPKTKYGRRVIDLGSRSLEMLRMHHEHQFKLKMAAGEKWREFNLIFTTNIGTPISHRNLLRDYKLQLKNAGVPVIRFHDLRHTAAALMLNNGVDLMVVSRRLGHARPSITLDQYGHLIPTKQAETAQLIDEIVAPISYTQLHPVAPKLHPKSKLKTRVLHQPPYTGV